MIPAEFKNRPRPEQSKRWPYILAIVLFLILDVLIGYLIYKGYFKENKADDSLRSVTAEDTSGALSDSLTQISSEGQTAESPQSNDEDEIRSVVDTFMQARLDRDLEQVKPYVTEEFLLKHDQESFAGTSSPSMSNYEITDIEYVSSDRYSISIQTSWKLNGDDAGTQNWTLVAIKSNDGYKIDDYSQL